MVKPLACAAAFAALAIAWSGMSARAQESRPTPNGDTTPMPVMATFESERDIGLPIL